MSEKRKPALKMLLTIGAKKVKFEMFPASLWTKIYVETDNLGRDRYRIRVNGKWWPKGEVVYITKTKAKNLLFQAIEL